MNVDDIEQEIAKMFVGSYRDDKPCPCGRCGDEFPYEEVVRLGLTAADADAIAVLAICVSARETLAELIYEEMNANREVAERWYNLIFGEIRFEPGSPLDLEQTAYLEFIRNEEKRSLEEFDRASRSMNFPVSSFDQVTKTKPS